jgi:hypothetical protein
LVVLCDSSKKEESNMKIRKRIISIILAVAMICIAMFSGYTSIQSHAETIKVSKTTMRKIKSIGRGSNRITTKSGLGYVRYKATRTGYVVFRCADARVGTNPNTIGSVGLTFFRYKNNKLTSITFSSGQTTLWMSTPGRRRRDGGPLAYNVRLKMKKGEIIVIRSNFLEKRMCNYNIKVS